MNRASLLLSFLLLSAGCADLADEAAPRPADEVDGGAEGDWESPKQILASFWFPPDDDDAIDDDDDSVDDDDSADDDDDSADDDDDSADNDDDSADNDDDSADDDDDDDDSAPPPCPPLGPDVTSTLLVTEPGWQLQLESEGWGTSAPTALGVSPNDGSLVLGGGLGTWGARPVYRLEVDGSTSSSANITDPDGAAVDSTGLAYAAGGGDLWQLGSISPAGGPDAVWHHTGGNLGDLVIDRARGDVVYASREDGSVLRVEVPGIQDLIFAGGAPTRIALDADGDLWVLVSGGAVYEVDPLTGASTLQYDHSLLHPDYATANRIDVDPRDGAVWTTAYYWGIGGTLTRWRPSDPTTLDLVVSDMTGGDNPDDLAWDGDCLHVSTPLQGKLLRLCACPE